MICLHEPRLNRSDRVNVYLSLRSLWPSICVRVPKAKPVADLWGRGSYQIDWLSLDALYFGQQTIWTSA